MTDYRVVFLEKSMLGRDVTMDKEEKILKACAGLAYSDMLSAGRFYLERGHKEDLCDALYKKVLEYKKFDQNIITDISVSLSEIINSVAVHEGKVTTYGLAQKFVNMMFKYMYVFKGEIQSVTDFECDCPIDSIILKSIKDTEHKWSRLTEEDYNTIQETIKLKLKNVKKSVEKELILEIGNMAYDFFMW